MMRRHAQPPGKGLGARLLFLNLALLALSGPAGAATGKEEVYEAPASFVSNAFGGKTPPAQTVALAGELAARTAKIMGHPYRSSRIRYWKAGSRTAWVLEEIGKTKPITVGIVVDQGRIASMKVLIYRESIGWEVRRPAFTGQFQGAALNGARLTRTVNGIHGATLSSDALRKLGALALLLHGAATAN